MAKRKDKPAVLAWELWDEHDACQSGISCPEEGIKKEMIDALYLDEDEEYALEIYSGLLGEIIAELTNSEGAMVGMAISR